MIVAAEFCEILWRCNQMFIRTLLLLTSLVAVSAHAQNDTLPTPETQKAELIGKRYLIDVRTPEEWKKDHIPGAILIPYDQIGQRFSVLGLDKQAPIGLFCKSGGRAGTAKNVLQSLGYRNVENLGGISDARGKLHLVN
jgi:phage shock protein E